MECDELVINQIWERLIETITNSIDKKVDLDEIVKILLSLTFDELGLFSSNFINGNAVEESFNKWLLNQLVYMLNFSISETTLRNNIRLQMDIMSAAFVKRPAFFGTIINEYMKVLKILKRELFEIQNGANDQNQVEINFFVEEPEILMPLYKDIKYRKLCLENTIDIEKNVRYLIMLLTHAIYIAFQSQPDIFMGDIIDCILDVYAKCSMSLKIHSITFFTKFFEQLVDPVLDLSKIYLVVLKGCDAILKNLPMWDLLEQVNLNHYKNFVIELQKLFEVRIWKTSLNKNCPIFIEIQNYSLQILIQLLRLNISNADEQYNSCVSAIVKYFSVVYEKTNELAVTNFDVDIFCKHLNDHKCLEKLMAFHTVQYYKCGVFINLCEENYWRIVLNAMESELNKKHLKLIISVLRITIYVEHLVITAHIDHNLLFHDDRKVIQNLIPLLKSMENSDLKNYIFQIYGLLLKSQLSIGLNISQKKKMLMYLLLSFQNQINTSTSNLDNKNMFHKLNSEDMILHLANIRGQYLETEVSEFFENKLHEFFCRILKNKDMLDLTSMWICHLPRFLYSGIMKVQTFQMIIKIILDKYSEHFEIFNKLKPCMMMGEVYFIQNFDQKDTIDVMCEKCNMDSNVNRQKCLVNFSNDAIKEYVYNYVEKKAEKDRLMSHLFLVNHFTAGFIEKHLDKFFVNFPNIVIDSVNLNNKTVDELTIFFKKIGIIILRKIKEAVNKSNRNLQLEAIHIIEGVAIGEIPEKIAFNYFKMLLFFLVLPDLQVVHKAHSAALLICRRRTISPNNFLNWYRQDCMEIITMLIVNIEKKGKPSKLVALFKELSYMFGFSCANEFICKNYKFLVAFLIPRCIEQPSLESVLTDMSTIIRKDFQTMLAASFLTCYVHISLGEDASMRDRCFQFIIENTKLNLYDLLHLDIKRTSEEILVQFDENPNFVLDTFHCVLSNNKSVPMNAPANTSSVNAKDIILYISTRFLGILTYFENNLMNPDVEKHLKVKRLRSLGAIIRFVGNVYITPIRYKVISLITTITASTDGYLKNICIDIWKIFLHNVDIKSLGQSLGRIILSLGMLLETNRTEINNIYKFLIISNGNLLSLHIPDLYFIENMDVDIEIKEFVSRQVQIACKGKSFIENFNFFQIQITHENLYVRIYGLKYLTKFVSENRHSFNKLIVDCNEGKRILEKVYESLMACCKHVDRNLKIEVAKCLGELGAIDPSHLFANFPQTSNDFSFGVQTDSFTIMALKELCRALQFPEDPKYVDNFSLAIQDILQKSGVCPKENKKIEVWESIPENMRQIMEPLLTSTYCRQAKVEINSYHPIFKSTEIHSYEDWAFKWSSKMVEVIEDENTKSLLQSFQPSMKRDRNILGLFLPYVLLHAIQTTTEQESVLIFEELSAVFEFTTNEHVPKTTVDRFAVPSFYSTSNKQLNGPEASTSSQDIGIKCAKVGFDILDFLERWLREWKSSHEGCTPSVDVERVDNFVRNFNKHLMAKSNYNCNEFARALMYIETYIAEDHSSRFQTNLSFLIKIYAELMDPDNLEGAVHMKKSNLSLEEQILYNSITDRLEEITVSYELAVTKENAVCQNYMDQLFHSYVRLDTPETALLITTGLWEKFAHQLSDDYFKECQAKPLWTLSRFDELGELLKDPIINSSTKWGVQCGQMLFLMQEKNSNSLNLYEKTNKARLCILNLLKTVNAELDSYHKGYSQIMKLHFISEIEKAYFIMKEIVLLENTDEEKCLNLLQQCLKDWELRLNILHPTVRSSEPVIKLRRILLQLIRENVQSVNIKSELNTEIGNLWLHTIKIYRKAGWFQQARLAIANAEKLAPPRLFVEKAKLFWTKGDQQNAFKVIREKISELRTNLPTSSTHRQLYAEAKFLQANYNADSMNICSEVNIQYFRESLEANKKSEKCLVYFAQYLDKMYSLMSPEQQCSSHGRDILCEVMQNYAKSMYYGCEFIYQSMPRLLSIWFDFSSQNNKEDGAIQTLRIMCDMVNKCSSSLPPFIFFSAFSQLVSRICHPSNEIYQVLKSIIIRLIQTYPQQSLWMILPVVKSSYPNRAKRCIEIYDDQRLANSQMQVLIKDFNTLAELLIELTNKEIPKTAKKCTVSMLVPRLPKVFRNGKFSNILLPFEKCMQITLPEFREQKSPANKHDAFPHRQIYITGIREEVTVLVSLQRPRKVTLLGSNGTEYTFMMKPKDDLRKDFRLMEFNALVKQYIFRDPQARQRRLKIRTYAVLPLNEECGIIEWVHNLDTFRNIIKHFHRMRKVGMSNRDLKAVECKPNDAVEKKREVFLKHLLPKHPPVFYEWFIYRFTTPHNWYQARSSYIKTIAVMSVVGYILGLGDRHGENILFDVGNGDAIHVDFNCLFNLGETYLYAEKVPFRLTHNMVHAMGPMGVEGLFRKCCEITMRVLKEQCQVLMSVLRPFVYDPLVTWNRSSHNTPHTERTDPKAMANVKRIEERLRGFVKIKGKTSSMPLSTEGQVNFVISEATDVDNLAAMFIGWGSYL